MSTEAIINLIFQLTGTLIAGSIGLWKFSEMQNAKLTHAIKNQNVLLELQKEQLTKSMNRIYERMDEREVEAHKTFVRLDVHNLTMEHLEAKTDEKFKTTIESFEWKMQSLTKAVTDAIARME